MQTCHAEHMSLDDLPDRLHRKLTKRAKAAGQSQSLTGYVQRILERAVSRPEASEVFERIAKRPRVDLGRSAADWLHDERERR